MSDTTKCAAVPFGSNAIRLSPREWLATGAIVAILGGLIPAGWQRIEPLAAGPDDRLPYSLGEDYWVFVRHCRRACAAEKTLVVGDSVIWGHYVPTDQTLSHHLNALSGADAFANLGVDGTHPAALAGLVESYGRSIVGRNVILFFNPLWISSERHDLSTTKEFSFQHPRLVPQFSPWIPCYRESLAGRLGIVVQRNCGFLGWTSHLRAAYFQNNDIPAWTMAHPYADPLRAVTLTLPSPDEPPSPPPVAEPWTSQRIERYNPRWVDLATSLQWQSFQRTVATLRARHNRVFVLAGPFNEHMLKESSLKRYRRIKTEIAAWLEAEKVPHFVPDALPSELYADASHPLGAGYKALAGRLMADPSFVAFHKGSGATVQRNDVHVRKEKWEKGKGGRKEQIVRLRARTSRVARSPSFPLPPFPSFPFLHSPGLQTAEVLRSGD